MTSVSRVRGSRRPEDRQFPRSIVERRRRPARWRPPDYDVAWSSLNYKDGLSDVRQQIRRRPVPNHSVSHPRRRTRGVSSS